MARLAKAACISGNDLGPKASAAVHGFMTLIERVAHEISSLALYEQVDHVLQAKYRYVHEWTVGDLLLWDHIGTWHYARPDYGPDEHRLMKRCQVMATKIFEPDFLRESLLPAHAA